MKEYINRIFIIFVSVVMLFNNISKNEFVIWFFIFAVFSLSFLYFSLHWQKKIFLVIYLLICVFYNEFLFLMPFVLYEISFELKNYYGFISVFILLADPFNAVLLILFSLLSVFMKMNDKYNMDIYKRYLSFYTDVSLKNTYIARVNKELLEKKEDDTQNAILRERNRIARDIHDNVGHTLTSAILRLTALNLDFNNDKIDEVKEELKNAMDDIRGSVYNIHVKSINIDSELKQLVDSFSFCEVEYINDTDNSFNLEFNLMIISIIKEALTNISKHSNATKAHLKLFFTKDKLNILITDNGTITNETPVGSGLIFMKKRIDDFGGLINISALNGFRIFITIDKERVR